MSDQPAPRSAHPLFTVGKEMASDLLATLVFAGLYAVTQNVYLAAGLAIGAGLGRIAYRIRHRVPIDTMQWLSLFLVIVFGGAALVTRDQLFVMLKPTLIYAAIGAVMLRPGWMTRYVPAIVGTTAADVAVLFGYLWAALMFATAAANLLLALQASQTAWAWFIGGFPLVSKLALVLLQYVTTRAVIRRRRAAPSALVPAV